MRWKPAGSTCMSKRPNPTSSLHGRFFEGVAAQ
jgi:hypothetical protein